MEIKELGIIVTLDDGKTREMILSKGERKIVISLLTKICDPIRVNETPLNGIELAYVDENAKT